MDCSDEGRQPRLVQQASSILSDTEGFTEQSLSGGRSEADDDIGLNLFDFCIEPGAAGGDFTCAGLLVDAALAARFPFEMLHCVGDIDFVASDAGFGEALIEQQAGESDEGRALNIFAVAGLFAHEDEPGASAAGPEDSLSSVLIERTGATGAGGVTEAAEIESTREKRSRRAGGNLGESGHPHISTR